MITEAQLDRALHVFNDVNTDAPRKSVREALRKAIEAAQPSIERDDAEITADVGILACENRDYLRLTVELKGESLRQFRISRGGAEGLHVNLGTLLGEQQADASGFDPALPFRTRDGRKVKQFEPSHLDPEGIWLGVVDGCTLMWWKPTGRRRNDGVRTDLDLVNINPAAPAQSGESLFNQQPSREWLRANLRHAIERSDDKNAKALILVARLALNSEDYDWFIEPDSKLTEEQQRRPR